MDSPFGNFSSRRPTCWRAFACTREWRCSATREWPITLERCRGACCQMPRTDRSAWAQAWNSRRTWRANSRRSQESTPCTSFRSAARPRRAGSLPRSAPPAASQPGAAEQTPLASLAPSRQTIPNRSEIASRRQPQAIPESNADRLEDAGLPRGAACGTLARVGQFHWDPQSYLALMRQAVPDMRSSRPPRLEPSGTA